MRRTFSACIFLADISILILADSLHHCGVLLDIQYKSLIDSTTTLKPLGKISTFQSFSRMMLIHIISSSPKNTATLLLPNVVSPSESSMMFNTTGSSIFLEVRHLPAQKLDVVSKELNNLLSRIYGDLPTAFDNLLSIWPPSLNVFFIGRSN